MCQHNKMINERSIYKLRSNIFLKKKTCIFVSFNNLDFSVHTVKYLDYQEKAVAHLKSKKFNGYACKTQSAYDCYTNFQV